MIRVALNNKSEDASYVERQLNDLAGLVLQNVYQEKKISLSCIIDLSVAIVNESEMKKLNNQLRQCDQTTDVLSVGDFSDCSDMIPKKNNFFLGEVILCYNYIKETARQKNNDIDLEFYIVYVHGILHLFGFEHGKIMFLLQEYIVREYLNKNE